MPKKKKSIPDNRADWTFGDAVWWHFFIHGTRPEGPSTDDTGDPWSPKDALHALGLGSMHTLWNWVDNDPPPYDTVTLERVLFGKSTRFNIWREELRRLLSEERAKPKPVKSKAAKPKPTGRALVLYEVEYEDEAESDVIDVEFEEVPPAEAEIIGNGREKPAETSPIVPSRPASQGTQYQHAKGASRLTFRAVVAGLLVASGVYLWARWPASHEKSKQAGTSVAKVEPPPVPVAPTTNPKQKPEPPKQDKTVTPTPEISALRPQPQPTKSAEPVQQETIAPVAPPPIPSKSAEPPKPEMATPATPPPETPQPPTEEERRAAELRRIEEQAIAARIAAVEAAKRKQEQDAIRRDQEAAATAQAQRDHEANERTLAAIGFTLKENTTVTGGPVGYVRTETVAECAVACLNDNDCDAFAFRKGDSPSPEDGTRTCYRYKKPLTFNTDRNYTSGERLAHIGTAPAAADAKPPQSGATVAEPAKPIAPAPPNAGGLIQCLSGPVKVTGFQLICDKLVVGGSALGSAQLRYSVNDINECAAKCSAVSRCGAFAYKTLAYRDKHDCEIMGPTTNMNNGAGWVSGLRQ